MTRQDTRSLTRLGNRQLEEGKKSLFLSCSLFKSQYRIIEAFAERQATSHYGLPVRGILGVPRMLARPNPS